MTHAHSITCLSRRDLLLGTSATAVATLLAACGGSSAATDTPKPAVPTTAPTPTTAVATPTVSTTAIPTASRHPPTPPDSGKHDSRGDCFANCDNADGERVRRHERRDRSARASRSG